MQKNSMSAVMYARWTLMYIFAHTGVCTRRKLDKGAGGTQGNIREC